MLSTPCTAFSGGHILAAGPLAEVALAVRAAAVASATPILVFDDTSGKVFDIDTHGSEDDILRRLAELPTPTAMMGPADESPPTQPARRGKGRPRLGVVAREVTLLPRHWEWLAAQPGGASVSLRRLVEEARRSQAGADSLRAARDAAYHFMSAIGGDLPGFEEATRALYAGDRPRMEEQMMAWPVDVREHALKLAFNCQHQE
jgi:hypothetical protein